MTIGELFQAYYDCRKNKRNTVNAIRFELNYESNLIELYNEIIDWRYKIWKSIAFIVDKPVKREIFAGDFRDRIVHHLVINKLNPIFEKIFIYDSYSCRKNKWTLFWIQRIDKFIRQATENYKKDAYILKLDISGFFMNMNKTILFSMLENMINKKYDQDDKSLLLHLIGIIISNEPTKNCIIKGKKLDWIWLPKTKSLFFSKQNTGFPIGNLTSQLFANLYLHDLDIYIKKELKIKYYWRYVDDFILIHENKNYLKEIISKIKAFLKINLDLNLHPKKIYLQHYTKWVLFLWAFIKPFRIYVWKRLKTNFWETIQTINKIIRENKTRLNNKDVQKNILSRLNSYLWLFIHYNTFKIRKRLLLSLNAYFWNYFYISGKYKKIIAKAKII